MGVTRTSDDPTIGFLPDGDRSPAVCSQCAILPEKRDRSMSDRSCFHTLRKHAALSDLRRSGGVPTRRLKKESWNWLKHCDRMIAAEGIPEGFHIRAPWKGCRGRRWSERVRASFWSECIELSNGADLPTLRQPRPSFCVMPHPNGRAVRHLTSAFDASSVQTDRIIFTAASLSILPTCETFPSFSLRTIRSICTMAPRCQLSTARFWSEAFRSSRPTSGRPVSLHSQARFSPFNSRSSLTTRNVFGLRGTMVRPSVRNNR